MYSNSKYTQEDSLASTKRITIPDVAYDDIYDDSDEEDFYDNYEPFEDVEFDDGEYVPFDPEEEEREHQAYISPSSRLIKRVKPIILTSPSKKEEEEKTPIFTWWDKNESVPDTQRMVNGVLNYAALLPEPIPNSFGPKGIKSDDTIVVQIKKKSKKNKKNAVNAPHASNPHPTASRASNHKSNDGMPVRTESVKNRLGVPTKARETRSKKQAETPSDNQMKPTRFCLSVVKKAKCFHPQCRFAHSYSELKECNFGKKCKKITVVQSNQDGTVELDNKNGLVCVFKHATESEQSYLRRVPQQHTSPKK